MWIQIWIRYFPGSGFGLLKKTGSSYATLLCTLVHTIHYKVKVRVTGYTHDAIHSTHMCGRGTLQSPEVQPSNTKERAGKEWVQRQTERGGDVKSVTVTKKEPNFNYIDFFPYFRDVNIK